MVATLNPPLPSAIEEDQDNLASLLHELGDVSPARVRRTPPAGSATVEDLIRLGDLGKRCELVDGTIVERAMGYWEDRIGLFIASLMLQFVNARKLGYVAGAQGFMQLGERLVRGPDVSFTRPERLAGQGDVPYPRAAFNLVVDVISVGNTPGEMLRKRREYLQAGVELIWQIDPRAETAEVYTPESGSETPVLTLRRGDMLDGAPVLPGFTIAVGDVLDAGKPSLDAQN